MKKTILIVLLGAALSSCGEPRYKCPDERATYYSLDGRIIETSNGISEGYVLIPEIGDAGSYMLGRYVRINNGIIVEWCKGVPQEIIENTIKPWSERHNKTKDA